MIGRSGLAMLSMLGLLDSPIMLRPPRYTIHAPGNAPTRAYPKGSAHYEPNGKREVARRLRQIRSGQLKVSA